ncbi:MAG: hypothetical protein MJZ81_12005, partial [Bacteroidales bacterium]|nr:hypothetical protein [Bacteroidales bacterium]
GHRGKQNGQSDHPRHNLLRRLFASPPPLLGHPVLVHTLSARCCSLFYRKSSEEMAYGRG